MVSKQNQIKGVHFGLLFHFNQNHFEPKAIHSVFLVLRFAAFNQTTVGPLHE